jgi:DNA-binding transcriptional ArsR family regulator
LINIDKVNSATNLLKGVAHPIRLAIMEVLRKGDKMCVTDIYKMVQVEQAVASQHLKILKDKGILDSVKDGKKINYYIKNEKFTRLLDYVEECNECD